MRDYGKLKQQMNTVIDNTEGEVAKLSAIANETNRVKEVARDVHIIVNDIDSRFKQVTKLNDVDITFLFFATALQCLRQYLLTQFTLKEDRPNDQEAANDSDKLKEKLTKNTEYTERKHRWYKPTLQMILTNPVSFDAQWGSPDFNLGLSGNAHRTKTLGHDPLLGWVFGTANIATSTLTTCVFQSYHVKTDINMGGARKDHIIRRADTGKVLKYTKEKLVNEGKDGRIIVGSSLLLEGIHLKSDVYSKLSLPLPIIPTISSEFAMKIADYGFDTANLITVGKQAGYSVLINFFVGAIHRLLYTSDMGSQSLYEVKTRKILSYSNTIATTSNLIQAAFRAYVLKDKKGAEKSLDIGGFMITLYRLISDVKFINKVKQEFLEKEFYNIVMGDNYNI